ncbi:hypothetical protein LguiA_031043 [Lonicera macranthoides]
MAMLIHRLRAKTPNRAPSPSSSIILVPKHQTRYHRPSHPSFECQSTKRGSISHFIYRLHAKAPNRATSRFYGLERFIDVTDVDECALAALVLQYAFTRTSKGPWQSNYWCDSKFNAQKLKASEKEALQIGYYENKVVKEFPFFPEEFPKSLNCSASASSFLYFTDKYRRFYGLERFIDVTNVDECALTALVLRSAFTRTSKGLWQSNYRCDSKFIAQKLKATEKEAL